MNIIDLILSVPFSFFWMISHTSVDRFFSLSWSSHFSPLAGHWDKLVRANSFGFVPNLPMVTLCLEKFAHGVTATFGHPPALAWGPPRAAGGDLLHRGPPWAAGAQPASPWSAPRAAGEPLLWRLEHLLPLLLHRPWCLQSCFFSCIVSLFSLATNAFMQVWVFSRFLTMLSLSCYHCHR